MINGKKGCEIRLIITFGNRIKYIRGALRQDKFVEILGTHRNTVSSWERNIVTPGVDLLLRIYEEFDINLNWLLSGKGDAYRSKTE